MNTILTVVILLAVVLICLRIAMPRLGSTAAGGVIERDGKAALIDCGTSPNCQGSFSSRENQRVEPFPLRGSAAESLAQLATLLNAQPGAEVVTKDERYLHATFTTPLMGYVDDMEFLVDENAQNIGVRSASRLGKSDLGANAKRIAALREKW